MVADTRWLHFSRTGGRVIQALCPLLGDVNPVITMALMDRAGLNMPLNNSDCLF